MTERATSSGSRDRPVSLAQQRGRRGVACFLDVPELRAGDELAATLKERVQGARAFVVVLSPAAMSSRWVQREIEWALAASRGVPRHPPVVASPSWYHFDTTRVGRVSMPSVHIRDLSGPTLEKLRVRARQNERSLQAELKLILEEAAGRDWGDTLARAVRMRRQLARRVHDDSAQLIARDRQRR